MNSAKFQSLKVKSVITLNGICQIENSVQLIRRYTDHHYFRLSTVYIDLAAESDNVHGVHELIYIRVVYVLYCIYPFLWRLSHLESFRSALDHGNWHCVEVYKPKRYRQRWVKDLPKVPTSQQERNSNTRPPVERHRLYQCATTPHVGILKDYPTQLLRRVRSCLLS